MIAQTGPQRAILDDSIREKIVSTAIALKKQTSDRCVRVVQVGAPKTSG